MRLFSAMAAVMNRIAANGWYTTPHAGRKPSTVPDWCRTMVMKSTLP